MGSPATISSLATRAIGPPPSVPAASTGAGPEIANGLAGNEAGSPRLCAADLRRDDLTGWSLSQYDLGKRIGSGGMGQVFRARHRMLGREFAIKFPSSEHFGNPEASQRFLREVCALGRLQHPNLIAAVDAGIEQGIHYCVTELLDGHDLQAWVDQRGPMPLGAACEVVCQAARGLAHAHALGIVHRDIKPSNVLLDRQGQVRVIDFGIVRTEGQPSCTIADQMLGTIDYMAPEQALDGRTATRSSDLWSLGGCLIFLLSGQAPYPDSTHPGMLAKLTAAAADRPQWLREQAFQLPAPVRDVLAAMLSRDPARRPAGCEEVAAALAPWADQSELCAWINQPKAGEGGGESAPAPAEFARPALRSISPLSRWIPVAGGAAAAAGLAAAILLCLPPAGSGPAPTAANGPVASGLSTSAPRSLGLDEPSGPPADGMPAPAGEIPEPRNDQAPEAASLAAGSDSGTVRHVEAGQSVSAAARGIFQSGASPQSTRGSRSPER